MKENVPAERDKFRKGIFYPRFFIIGPQKKREHFKNNMDSQNTKILVLTFATQNQCDFFVHDWK